ncbi:MAG: hypothetical protein JWL62_3826 [Hyphomicrobiales bacterium]|nr:hypothetical protein [Hyphomicrobiales bacterium]
MTKYRVVDAHHATNAAVEQGIDVALMRARAAFAKLTFERRMPETSVVMGRIPQNQS